MAHQKVSIGNMASAINDILTDYAKTTTDGVKKAVAETGKEVQADIKSSAPVKSGKYAKSWSVKNTKENSHALEVTVYSRNRYQMAHLLEFGHAKRGGGRTRAISHIAPAEERGIRTLEEKIERQIRNG